MFEVNEKQHQKNTIQLLYSMKKEILSIGLMVAGGILGSIAQETAKSSIGLDDAYVSIAAAGGTIFLASQLKGDMKNVAMGASAVMGMNAISESAMLLAQKTSNPTVDKLVELLPHVKAPNVLANPNIAAPVDNVMIDNEGDQEGVQGLYDDYQSNDILEFVK